MYLICVFIFIKYIFYQHTALKHCYFLLCNYIKSTETGSNNTFISVTNTCSLPLRETTNR